jgi:hypothetical protein
LRIHNLTKRLIVLPPVGEFQDTIRLLPGENQVIDGHVEALQAEPAKGKPDHRLYLEELLGCERVNRRGELTEFQPQIKILTTKDKPVDIEPKSLVDRALPTALAFVDVCDSARVLTRWRKADQRAEVTTAIDARLAAIRDAA